jgi:putative Mg2+ transporter-C (MgtC) family protein
VEISAENSMNTSWLSESWRVLWPSPWVNVLLGAVAVLCGMMVGSEWKLRRKSAGVPILALVCLGAAVFTMISFAFTSNTGDSGRVAAQIVTGIGFLGAAVILYRRRFLNGALTATSMWMVAAIGMTVGAGYAMAGVGLSLLVSLLLVGLTLYETHWNPSLERTSVTLEYAPKNGITRSLLEGVLAEYDLASTSTEWTEYSDDDRASQTGPEGV